MQPDPEVRKSLPGMQHERALQEMKFTGAAQESEDECAVGNSPTLVSKVRARRSYEGQILMSLQAQRGNAMDLVLGDTLLYRPMKLVQDTPVKAEWEISLSVPIPTCAPTEEVRGRTVN